MRTWPPSTIRSTFFVFASLCELFGLPMVEAMARGLPVVVAAIDSNVEVTRGAALQYPPADAAALADALAALMKDSAERTRRSGLSLKAGENYSWAKAADATVKALELVCMNLQPNKLDPSRPPLVQGQTRAHYDSYPFDFLTPADEDEIRDMQPAPFRRLVEKYLKRGDAVADIGCGGGRGTLYLTRAGFRPVSLDISDRSLRLAQRRAPSAMFLCASNLALPFADEGFDAVVSDGVIHHTPDVRASFRENARVLKPRGLFYLGVYNRRGYYYYFFTYLGPVFRFLEKYRLGRLVIYLTALPLYWLVHLIKSKGRRTWRGAVNLFYDYIMTPRASFHSFDEICAWGLEDGLKLLEYDPSVGNVHVFIFEKRTEG